MLRRRSTTLFCSALGASLVVHAALFAWVGRTIEHRRLLAELQRAQDVMIVLPQELKLGLDAPSPEDKTWLGLDEAQSQAAPMSPIEQAAFSEQPLAPSEEVAQAQEMVKTTPPSPLLDPAARHQIGEAMAQAKLTIARSTGEFSTTLNRLRNSLASAMQPSNSSADSPTAESEESTPVTSAQSPPQTTPSTAEPAPPTSTAKAQRPSQGDPGHLAEKESTPSSVIDIPPDQWRFGKPLAAEGLELQPRRPSLTLLTMLTAAPGNPLCLIRFDRQGVAVEAAILRSSGDRRVDDAILASLYRWRAVGKALKELNDDKTADVTIRILLTRPRVDQST